MTMQSAISDWFNRVDRANTNNEAVLDSIPEEPERGSYYWWARIARENTGQALCDSGGHYGYTYEQPVPIEEVDPITISFYDGKPESATISTIHWLHNMLDADDDVAEAIEKVLYWIGTWLYPREYWHAVIHSMLKGDKWSELERIYNYCTKIEHDTLDDNYVCYAASYVAQRVGEMLAEHHYSSDFYIWQLELSDEEYIRQAYDEFPAKEAALLYENEIGPSEWGGDNTYNHEEDLSQTIQFDVLDGAYDNYVIVRTHNGCDVRGGYSTPVVARAYDIDYFWSWTCDAYCHHCQHNGWEMMYYYGKALEKHEHPLTEEVILGWKKTLAEMEAIENGQKLLHGFAAPKLEFVSDDIARMLIADYDAQIEAEEEYQPPYALIEIGSNEWATPDPDGYSNYPAGAVRLICPDCGKYSVGVYNSGAYGF